MMQKKPLQFTYVTENNKNMLHNKFHFRVQLQIKHYKNMLLYYK
jgi:hypothetical protein